MAETKKPGCAQNCAAGVLLIGLCIWGLNSCVKSSREATQAEQKRRDSLTPEQRAKEDTVKTPHFADESLQASRKDLLQQLAAKGLIHKIKSDEPYDIWVTPRFLALNFDDKQTFASVAFAWLHRLPKTAREVDLDRAYAVTIVHSVSGKRAGDYSIDGLRID